MRTHKDAPGQEETPARPTRHSEDPPLRAEGLASGHPDILRRDVALALQRTVGNSAVTNVFRSHMSRIGGSQPETIQRLKETAENRVAIQGLKQQYLAKFPKSFKKWSSMLTSANSLEALRAAVNAAAPLAASQNVEPERKEPAQERGPETVTTTDPFTHKKVGPFNGRSGPSSEVKGAKDYVFYDQKEQYCISRDRDEHAGEGYKLYKRTGTGWQRLDTITLDGTPMGRG